MKINREMVARAGLVLLNEIGLEQLTLRRLAEELDVQAATLYWHFKSKQELLDEMATTVLAEGASLLVAQRSSGDWTHWVARYGNGMRKTLMAYRDGARMISGTRLTTTAPLVATEMLAARMIASGFTLRSAVVLLNTIYLYTLSFVEEEQSVSPAHGQQSAEELIRVRNARLDPAIFPLHRQASPILFGQYDRRYREGLKLIVTGARLRQPRLPVSST